MVNYNSPSRRRSRYCYWAKALISYGLVHTRGRGLFLERRNDVQQEAVVPDEILPDENKATFDQRHEVEVATSTSEDELVPAESKRKTNRAFLQRYETAQRHEHQLGLVEQQHETTGAGAVRGMGGRDVDFFPTDRLKRGFLEAHNKRRRKHMTKHKQ